MNTMADLQDILDEQERVRRASFEKLRAQVDTTAILDLEGFTDALDHLARCQGHKSGLMLPITEEGLAAHFGFHLKTKSWIRALPVREGYLRVAPEHVTLLNALLAVKDVEQHPLSVSDLSITFFQHGQRASLSNGAGFVAGRLLGLIRGLEPADGDHNADAFTLPVELELPSAAYLCAYKTGAAWGGPEEGGWSYDTGSLVEAWTTTPKTYNAQMLVMQQLLESEDLDADLIELHYRTPPAGWPHIKPKYC
jgi:hypothetical protein